jgi:ribonuclease Z
MTCMQVPQLGIMFDVGHCYRSLASTPRLLITHGHGDHCGGLVAMLSLRLLHGLREPLQVYAPAPIVDALRTVVTCYESIQGHAYSWEITPVSPGDEFALDARRHVRVFSSPHVIETVGYTVFERVNKLRDEFKHLPGAEIGRRKHAGDDIFDSIERSLVSFPGDTTIDVLEHHPELLNSQVLLLESTYLDERRTPKQCLDHGHIHFDQVLEHASDFNNEHLVLTHFSQSYKPYEVAEIVKRRSDGKFRPEVHVLIPNTSVWPG